MTGGKGEDGKKRKGSGKKGGRKGGRRTAEGKSD